MSKTNFQERVADYFGNRLGWGHVAVRDARRLAGGISRETWMVELALKQSDGTDSVRRIVLRMDPVSSLLESNRNTEYAVIRAFEALPAFPVARTICNEDDTRPLGSSFMASEAMPGVAEIAAIVQPPYAAAGRDIALNHFRVLGRIATLDVHAHGLHRLLPEPAPDGVALAALAPWSRSLDERNLGPAPITAGTLRYLRRDLPPPPSRIAVVHGDFRLGNCLYETDGRITAVLDWEMVHLGDPLEDLAWALMDNWRPRSAKHLVAGYITEDEALSAWQETSGQTVDRAALHWWKVFSQIKAMAMFSAGGYNFLTQPGTELVHAVTAWLALDQHESKMIDLMGVLA